MIVKCIPNKREFRGSWVKDGKEYQVFAVRHRVDNPEDQRLECLVVSEVNYRLAMEDMDQFEIISDYIPSSWGICRDNAGWVCLAPRDWHENIKSGRQWDFVDAFAWDPDYDFVDGYEQEIFIDAAEKMIAEEKEYLTNKAAGK